MKKIVIAALTSLALATGSANIFAAMHVDGKSVSVTSSPDIAFEGTVTYAQYFYQNNKPSAAVDVANENGDFIQISFTGDDLVAGAALLNAVDKPLVVFFSDTNFTVESVMTYNSSKSKLTRPNLHRKSISNQ